jgi:hypothetical protein
MRDPGSVSGMLIGDAKEYFGDVVKQIDRLGYETSWRLINCAD